MATTDQLEIKNLSLDLGNYRTIKQKDENTAIRTMISINPDWFFALTESLITNGYLPTENIIILKNGKELIVKEGNRRVGALKIISGLIKHSDFNFPSDLKEKIAAISKEWKTTNAKIPCAVYEASESDLVNRIVRLTHGKGEKAGRDKWNAVARARHNRDENGGSEPGLDLLEKYLKHGENVTDLQRERWSGDYPLTVLDEAIKKLAPKFGAKTAKDLAHLYPDKVKNRKKLESILVDVGTETLDFKMIRDESEPFSVRYGIHIDPKPAKGKRGGKIGGKDKPKPKGKYSGKNQAFSTNDPKAVINALKNFTPQGNYREKLVSLLEEARLLRLENHPLSFCFLLRSMFEISAKAYCKDHEKQGGPSTVKADGQDRQLVDILRDITDHLTKNKTDKAMIKALHGAMTEMGTATGFLSVTSMNQLIHHPRFSVNESHISNLFFNVFPLLEEMNR